MSERDRETDKDRRNRNVKEKWNKNKSYVKANREMEINGRESMTGKLNRYVQR